MELKVNLKKLLAEKNLKVTQLSRSCGVPLQTLHNWLSGQPPRNITQVKAVARYFNVTLDFLLFGERPVSITDYKDKIEAGVFEVILIPYPRKGE